MRLIPGFVNSKNRHIQYLTMNGPTTIPREETSLLNIACSTQFSHRRPRICAKILMILLLISNFKGHAQISSDYSVHANIIYYFTKYIDWPENRKGGDFVIGVVGDSPLYDELKKLMKNKMVGNQTILIRHLSASQNTYNCHILYITEEKSGSVKKIAGKTIGSPVLLVSEEEGMASMGSCINLVVESDRLKLEINKNNIDQRQLNIASELLHLGRIVK